MAISLDKVTIVDNEEGPACEGYGTLTGSDPLPDVIRHESPYGNSFPRDKEYAARVLEAEVAIDAGQKPVLCEKGTSGCYFVQDKHGVSQC